MRLLVSVFFTVCLGLNISWAQQTIVNQSGVKMDGQAYVNDNGAYYGAVLHNSSNKFAYVSQAVFKARFGYDKWSNSKEEYQRKSTTKRRKFNKLFMAPNTSYEKESTRKDTDNKIYMTMKGMEGEIESVTFGSNATMEGYEEMTFEETMTLKETDQYTVTAGFRATATFYGSYKNYPVKITVTNKTMDKLRDVSVNVECVFQGISLKDYKSFKKIKEGDSKSFQAELGPNARFNFQPRVFIKLI